MDCIWLVVHGRIDLFDRQADGHESIVGVFGPGRWAAWAGLFTSAPRIADITTASNTALIEVPATTMRRVLAQHPEIYPLLLDEIGTRVQILLQWTGQSAIRNDLQRLAGLLHCLAQVEASQRLVVTASQARLAQTMGIGRQQIGKCVEALSVEGLIRRSYGRVEICDMDRLLAFARKPRRTLWRGTEWTVQAPELRADTSE